MRRIALVLCLFFVVGLPAAAHASGGGGCPPPITSGSGSDVSMEDFCFEPTVLYVAPGTEVTFTNNEGFRAPHTVTGANRAWGGYRKVRMGKSSTYLFDTEGVYPYYCLIHIGMVGTVVVDDELPNVLPTPSDVDRIEPVAATTGSKGGGSGDGGEAFAIFLGAGLALIGVGRLSRRLLPGLRSHPSST